MKVYLSVFLILHYLPLVCSIESSMKIFVQIFEKKFAMRIFDNYFIVYVRGNKDEQRI